MKIDLRISCWNQHLVITVDDYTASVLHAADWTGHLGIAMTENGRLVIAPDSAGATLHKSVKLNNIKWPWEMDWNWDPKNKDAIEVSSEICEMARFGGTVQEGELDSDMLVIDLDPLHHLAWPMYLSKYGVEEMIGIMTPRFKSAIDAGADRFDIPDSWRRHPGLIKEAIDRAQAA